MAVDFGIEFPLAPLIAVAIATVVGLLVAVSALRVRGVSLAVVTLAAAVAIEKFGFANYKWGGGSGASPVPPPKLFGFSLGAGLVHSAALTASCRAPSSASSSSL